MDPIRKIAYRKYFKNDRVRVRVSDFISPSELYQLDHYYYLVNILKVSIFLFLILHLYYVRP